MAARPFLLVGQTGASSILFSQSKQPVGLGWKNLTCRYTVVRYISTIAARVLFNFLNFKVACLAVVLPSGHADLSAHWGGHLWYNREWGGEEPVLSSPVWVLSISHWSKQGLIPGLYQGGHLWYNREWAGEEPVLSSPVWVYLIGQNRANPRSLSGPVLSSPMWVYPSHWSEQEPIAAL